MSANMRGTGAGATGSPSPYLLVVIALAGVAAVGCSVALALNSDHVADPELQAALYNWMTLPFVLGGVVAWWRRPDSRFGLLMIATGFALFVSNLQWSNASLLYTVGLAVDLLPLALLFHVLLAYPSGRLQRRIDRGVVAGGYVAAVGVQVAKMVLGVGGPDNALSLANEPSAANTVQDVQLVAMIALALVVVGLLAAGRRSLGRPVLRSSAWLVDCFGLALVMVALLLLAGLLEWPAFETIRRVTFVTIGLAPVAFLAGLLDARLARSDVADLFVELRANPAPGELQDALAQALRDRSLSLAYWLPEYASWADLDGQPVELPDGDGARATRMIEQDGVPLAALVHDRSLLDEPELLDAVTAGAGIALENAQLHADLRARLEELKGSRGRVLEAGRKERQRLERNLHDGAQQRLIALSIDLGLLERRLADDPEARARLDHARREIALSLEELRDVARGIHPAVLSGHGLSVALESLAARATVPVSLQIGSEERMPEPVEVAAYYVVSESLTNIDKHARAGAATVDVQRSDGHVVVEIVDDGIGGADTERGTGLRGLADRVEAQGGTLRVWTPRGGGTRVRAEIPCV
jgi:signal transduction histidine kinase